MFFIILINCDPSVIRTDAIIDLEFKLDSKPYFHPNVDYIFSHSVRMLGLISTGSFSASDTLLALCRTSGDRNFLCLNYMEFYSALLSQKAGMG